MTCVRGTRSADDVTANIKPSRGGSLTEPQTESVYRRRSQSATDYCSGLIFHLVAVTAAAAATASCFASGYSRERALAFLLNVAHEEKLCRSVVHFVIAQNEASTGFQYFLRASIVEVFDVSRAGGKMVCFLP